MDAERACRRAGGRAGCEGLGVRVWLEKRGKGEGGGIKVAKGVTEQ